MPEQANPAHPDRRSFLRTFMLAGAAPFIPSSALNLDSLRSTNENLDHSPPTATVASIGPARIRFVPMKEALQDLFEAIECLDERYNLSDDLAPNKTSTSLHSHCSACHREGMKSVVEFLSSTAGTDSPGTETDGGVSGLAPAVLFHPHMRAKELVTRMVCTAAGLDARTIWTKPVSTIECVRLARAAGQLLDIPILIGETEDPTSRSLSHEAPTRGRYS